MVRGGNCSGWEPKVDGISHHLGAVSKIILSQDPCLKVTTELRAQDRTELLESSDIKYQL